jgi:hypothetical protein
MKTTVKTLKWLKLKRLITTNVGRDVEQLSSYKLPMGVYKW